MRQHLLSFTLYLFCIFRLGYIIIEISLTYFTSKPAEVTSTSKPKGIKIWPIDCKLSGTATVVYVLQLAQWTC